MFAKTNCEFRYRPLIFARLCHGKEKVFFCIHFFRGLLLCFTFFMDIRDHRKRVEISKKVQCNISCFEQKSILNK